MTNMVKVSKDDYDSLIKFHPGVIRYLIDLSTVSGSNVNSPPKKSSRQGVQYNIRNPNYCQLATKKFEPKPNTITAKLWPILLEALNSDPTEVMRRRDLVEYIFKNTKSSLNHQQVVAFVAQMVRSGFLRQRENSL